MDFRDVESDNGNQVGGSETRYKEELPTGVAYCKQRIQSFYIWVLLQDVSEESI